MALLPKSVPGFRPIGLFPWLPKVWAKARRIEAVKWEAANDRDYLYAGVGRGADHAVWKQAAHAELAATMPNVSFGQALYDLVKAFDMVPHHLLVTEAMRLGYSLWLLKLSIAAYRAERVIRIDGVFSKTLQPQRSLTAGSGFATTEMRIIMINIVDRTRTIAPYASPKLYVDDLSVEVSGGEKFVADQLVDFSKSFCGQIADAKMIVSDTKTFCTASSAKLGRSIAERLKNFGVQYKARVVSLGAGLGAGKRRAALMLNKRLKGFKARLPRFRKLAGMRVSTARILRTGGIAAMTYGQAVTGVPNTTLLHQRRAAARAAAPAGGGGGQDLDLTLMLADGSRRGKADPAYEAHAQPIGQWAEAVWHDWLPSGALHKIIDSAKSRLAQAKSAALWHHVRGPAAATVASAQRLGWQVVSAVTLRTDEGRILHLDRDPPVVIRQECQEAVRRWRNKRIMEKLPHLGSPADSHGVFETPIWQVLNSKGVKNFLLPQYKSSLQSAIADRQWPQDRAWTAGLVEHDRCVFCVRSAQFQRLGILDDSTVKQETYMTQLVDAGTKHPAGRYPAVMMDKQTSQNHHADIGADSGGDNIADRDEFQEQGVPLPEYCDIQQAPVGTTWHRLCGCPHMQAVRAHMCPDFLRPLLEPDVEYSKELLQSLCSGLFPLPKLEVHNNELPPPGGTFNWIRMEPHDGVVKGTVYTDGSRINNNHPDTKRLGWAFVVMDQHNHCIAIARGSPPDYIRDVPGAEAWALVQATRHVMHGSIFKSDCKPCIDAIQLGRNWACTAKRPLARVFNELFTNIDDCDVGNFIWMPSHTSAKQVDKRVLSDGNTLSFVDRLANAAADEHAKLAAAQYAVHPDVINQLDTYQQNVIAALQWLGVNTYCANHAEGVVKRDADVSRVKISKFQTEGGIARRKRKKKEEKRPTTGEDQLLEKSKRWATSASGEAQGAQHKSHSMQRTGNLIWCNKCGCYATLRGRGLAKECQPVQKDLCGGRAQQLRFLVSGRHPKTGQRLAAYTTCFNPYEEQVEQGMDAASGAQAASSLRGDEPQLAKSQVGRMRLRARAREANSRHEGSGDAITELLEKVDVSGTQRGGAAAATTQKADVSMEQGSDEAASSMRAKACSLMDAIRSGEEQVDSKRRRITTQENRTAGDHRVSGGNYESTAMAAGSDSGTMSDGGMGNEFDLSQELAKCMEDMDMGLDGDDGTQRVIAIPMQPVITPQILEQLSVTLPVPGIKRPSADAQTYEGERGDEARSLKRSRRSVGGLPPHTQRNAPPRSNECDSRTDDIDSGTLLVERRRMHGMSSDVT